jgi:cell division protein FtsI (penicillin-binding protein 3)
VIVAVIGFGYAGLVARAVQLQALDSEWLAARARSQSRATVTLTALRGEIADRRGEPLAISTDVESVAASPRRISEPRRAAARLAPILGLKRKQIERRLTQHRSFVWIKRWVTPQEAERVRALALRGVDLVAERRRLYPHRELAAAYVGFAGRDEVGLSGFELAFDRALAGAPSALPALRDARGRKRVAGDRTPELRRGARLVLAIDARLQNVAERALDRAIARTGANHGMIVAMDPRKGDLLAVAQRPGFDPNRFWEEAPRRFRARTFTDPFEPGSTLKPFVLALALEAGVVQLEDRVNCEGGAWKVADRVIHDWKPYGVLTASDVLIQSSNIGAAKIGAALGGRRLVEGLRRFGFGRRVGSAFPGESPGLVRSIPPGRVVDLSTLSFGQGISATALQLAVAGAALANGGRRIQPRPALRVEGTDGIYEFPSERGEQILPGHVADQVLQLLRAAVERGTGRQARITGIPVAGKTGTAQKVFDGRYSQDRFVASFLGFIPAISPRVVVVVVLDEPREPHTGGGAAAPVFREVASYVTRLLGLRTGETG